MLLKKKFKSLFTSRSWNSKTGDNPQQWIGKTREESLKSCTDCPLKAKLCYAYHGGTVIMGQIALIKSRARGKDKSIDYALNHRAKTAKIIRIGAIGEPSNASDTMEAIRKGKAVGLAIVGYTHNWKTAKWLKGSLMASADNISEAIDAISLGWRVYLHMEKAEIAGKAKGKFYGGRFTFITCPHARTGIQCNECRLCDASKRAVDLIITDNL